MPDAVTFPEWAKTGVSIVKTPADTDHTPEASTDPTLRIDTDAVEEAIPRLLRTSLPEQ